MRSIIFLFVLVSSPLILGGVATAQSCAADVCYKYDDLGRLIEVNYPGDDRDVGYFFDAAGNRQAVVVAAEGELPLEPPRNGGIIVVPLNGFTVIPVN